jgi:hypothetical protein
MLLNLWIQKSRKLLNLCITIKLSIPCITCAALIISKDLGALPWAASPQKLATGPEK